MEKISIIIPAYKPDASAPDMPVGNKLHSQFILDDTQITVDGTDVVCLRKDNQQLQYWSPHEVCIKEERV